MEERPFVFFLFQELHVGKERTHCCGGCKALGIIREALKKHIPTFISLMNRVCPKYGPDCAKC